MVPWEFQNGLRGCGGSKWAPEAGGHDNCHETLALKPLGTPNSRNNCPEIT